jgi:hypothetical protein
MKDNNITFEDWATVELVEYLVDKEVYNDLDRALLTDRCDLIEECKWLHIGSMLFDDHFGDNNKNNER